MTCAAKIHTPFGPPTLHPAPFLATTSLLLPHCNDRMTHIESDILQILGGFSNMHTVDGLGSFMSVLKVNTKI